MLLTNVKAPGPLVIIFQDLTYSDIFIIGLFSYFCGKDIIHIVVLFVLTHSFKRST